MFPSFLDPKNWNVVDAFKNLYNGGGAQQQQTIGGGNPLVSTIPNYPYAGYQVQGGDTFDSIAQKNNLTTPQIQQANGGMLVPPPAGRFINLPARATPGMLNPPLPQQAAPFMTYQQAQQAGRVPQTPQTNTPYWQLATQQPQSPVSAVPMNQAGMPSYGWNSYASQFTNTNAQAQANDIAVGQTLDSLNNGQLPQSISLYSFNNLRNPETGQKFTHKDMMENGYSFNPVTGSYTLGQGQQQQQKTAGPGNTDYSKTAAAQQYAANNTAFVDQKRWDPVSKKYVRIGDLINQGKLDVHTGQYNPYGYGHRGGGGGGYSYQPAVQMRFRPNKKQLHEQWGGG